MHFEVDGPQPRLDTFLVSQLPELSRSRLKGLIDEGHVTINGKPAKPKHSLALGDMIEINIPEPVALEVIAQDLPLSILHEDEDLIVVDKTSGMVVHPAVGNVDGTLVNALLHHCQGKLAGINGIERPGIVHRLDKDTSGCIVVAKTDRAMQSLVSQFADRETEKIYLAVTTRPPAKETDTIFTNIGRHPVNRQQMAVLDPGAGKPAITDYEILGKKEDGTCLVRCKIHTGRTHQIRVHLKHVGATILGDPIYGKATPLTPRLLLHARYLSFLHPANGKRVAFEAPVPDEFLPWMD